MIFRTFFQDTNWPLKDSADPLDGWNLPEILEVDSGAATNDIYGKLFYHLQERFSAFLCRLSTHRWEFQLLNFNAVELHN